MKSFGSHSLKLFYPTRVLELQFLKIVAVETPVARQ
jgi:hypothetical protein